jgi:hypothetical protein
MSKKRLTAHKVEVLLHSAKTWEPETDAPSGLAHAALTRPPTRRLSPLFAALATCGAVLWLTLGVSPLENAPVPAVSEASGDLIPVTFLETGVAEPAPQRKRSASAFKPPLWRLRDIPPPRSHRALRTATYNTTTVAQDDSPEEPTKRPAVRRRRRARRVVEPQPALWTTDTVTRKEQHLVTPVVVVTETSEAREYLPAVMTTPLSENTLEENNP